MSVSLVLWENDFLRVASINQFPHIKHSRTSILSPPQDLSIPIRSLSLSLSFSLSLSASTSMDTDFSYLRNFSLLIAAAVVFLALPTNGLAGRNAALCNLYKGRWVYDERQPVYDTKSCPFVRREFDCQKFGRPDKMYLKYRWKPEGCEIPRWAFLFVFFICLSRKKQHSGKTSQSRLVLSSPDSIYAFSHQDEFG